MGEYERVIERLYASNSDPHARPTTPQDMRHRARILLEDIGHGIGGDPCLDPVELGRRISHTNRHFAWFLLWTAERLDAHDELVRDLREYEHTLKASGEVHQGVGERLAQIIDDITI